MKATNANITRGDREHVKAVLLETEQHRYDPRYVKHFGADAAIFLSQLVYRDGHGMDEDGWIYKSEREWEQETGLSRRRQRNARKVLIAKGVMEERRGKEPGSGRPVNYYRLDGIRLLNILDPEWAEDEGLLIADTEDIEDGNTDPFIEDGITDPFADAEPIEDGNSVPYIENGISDPFDEDGISGPPKEDGSSDPDIHKNTQESHAEAHAFRDSTSVGAASPTGSSAPAIFSSSKDREEDSTLAFTDHDTDITDCHGEEDAGRDARADEPASEMVLDILVGQIEESEKYEGVDHWEEMTGNVLDELTKDQASEALKVFVEG